MSTATREKNLTVLCVHLYDDFSGSANVCSQVIEALKQHGVTTHVLTGSHGDQGFIRSRHSTATFPYRLFSNRLLLLSSFVWAQLALFFKVARACTGKGVDVVYASTVLPAAATAAAALCGKKVVSHVHETGLGSRLLFRCLEPAMVRFSSRLVCVSHYVRKTLDLPAEKTVVVPNSLPKSQWKLASEIAGRRMAGAIPRDFTIIMACSLLWYKGMDSFIELARALEKENARTPCRFKLKLLLNADAAPCDKFIAENNPPACLSIVRRPAAVFEHYADASLVLNLSHAEACVESFGLTLLEAMACAIPVVSPLHGGCAELFEDGNGGWRIDSRNIDALRKLVLHLAHDEEAYRRASARARDNALKFSPEHFEQKIIEAITTGVQT